VWDIGRPHPALDHLATAGKLVGRVLDVGCGTGKHALVAASLGYEAVGVDMSKRAIELAKTKAAERGMEQGPDPVVLEVAKSEADAFDALDQVVERLGREVPPKLALREAPQRDEIADRMRHLVRQDSPGYDYLMTSEEQIDVETFVALLNEDLGTEYQSIIQYTNHIATITGAEFLGVIDELKLHIGQELSHAQVLAEQVSFLGGEPATIVPSVERASDSRNALKADLRLETDQLERYRQRFAQANELNLADVAEALRPLLEQTQEHVRDLRTALGD
jgi:bacterioferritin